eukprot:Lithocolla_globosa_v1_NODE_4369_length_1452_cov_3913.355047.p3 type:complete len:107 gc:universal NODE_4369_length_1452_cov_3913.355047:456-776(+)
MEILETFNKSGKDINIYGNYEEPLFLAKEIGEWLELKNVRSSLSSIKESWRVVQPMDTLGGRQEMTFLKEMGLYKLCMRSDKPEAESFQEWITSNKMKHYGLITHL